MADLLTLMGLRPEPEQQDYYAPVNGTYASGPHGGHLDDRGGGRLHAGGDWSADPGTGAFAMTGGTVLYVGYDGAPGGYGAFADIKGDDGRIIRYATHDGVDVRQGQRVEQGDRLGTVGVAPGGTYSHLHAELIDRSSPLYDRFAPGAFVKTSTYDKEHPLTSDWATFLGIPRGHPVEAGRGFTRADAAPSRGLEARPMAYTGTGAPPIDIRALERSTAAPATRAVSGISPMQEMLSKIGIDVGAIDGFMGPRTRGGIETFQRGAGLPVTGEYDPKTRSTLEMLAGRQGELPGGFGSPVTPGGVRAAASGRPASAAPPAHAASGAGTTWLDRLGATLPAFGAGALAGAKSFGGIGGMVAGTAGGLRGAMMDAKTIADLGPVARWMFEQDPLYWMKNGAPGPSAAVKADAGRMFSAGLGQVAGWPRAAYDAARAAWPTLPGATRPALPGATVTSPAAGLPSAAPERMLPTRGPVPDWASDTLGSGGWKVDSSAYDTYRDDSSMTYRVDDGDGGGREYSYDISSPGADVGDGRTYGGEDER